MEKTLFCKSLGHLQNRKTPEIQKIGEKQAKYRKILFFAYFWSVFPIFCLFFSYFLDSGVFLFCRWPRLLQTLFANLPSAGRTQRGVIRCERACSLSSLFGNLPASLAPGKAPGGTSRSFGGVLAEVSGRGPRLLRSCLGVEISTRIPSEVNF